jgi:hypothetical protein
MVKYVFIGGKQPSDAVHTDTEGKVTLNEATDPTEVPPTCYAFGLQFQLGVPLDVTPDKFRTREHYDNAIRKLQTNRFFKPFAEDAEFVDMPAPAAEPKRRGRPKAIAATTDEHAE